MSIPGPDGRDLDRIRLLGLRAFGHHGVLAHERAQGQTFVADVVLHLDTRAAAATDDLADTVSYATVAEDVVAVLGGEPVDLLETLAERIAAVVLAHGVRAVDVTVHKPGAPLSVPFDDVELVIRRHADRDEDRGARAAGIPADDATGDARPTGDGDPTDDGGPIGEAGPTDDATGDAGRADDRVGAEVPGSDRRPAGPLTTRPAAEVPFVLALGANLGDAVATLRATVAALTAAEDVEVSAVSPLARTAAVLAPGQPDQPDYLNAVVVGTTTLAPLELFDLARRLEDAHGRAREERWGARTLDVDVITYADLRSDDPELTLPHPRAHERAFVLLPWSQVEPDAVLPEHGGVAELADRAADRSTVRWLALDWLEGPGEQGAR
ncbi:2-amino-4-hydroxy-6-hydroxymethyldihydropteridine diphosphokinase [Georgenia muralis]|uniref:Bifunctional folate synthesis protein n=1 Tax=Georgenia muralis TaxID=154117 RepID=A0A3N4ZNX5_9MICO|nr:2-amino-4-hydroxy-6-hydroxymethyldihydropteridine diphosphokinase [Georgenia muralis]RPF27382.1 dihydroneopterin aldolase/2-amino-4-hydroxy-6-hydroxymethyldihydropteridine diphosphokinase [Georgenia muralis]